LDELHKHDMDGHCKKIERYFQVLNKTSNIGMGYLISHIKMLTIDLDRGAIAQSCARNGRCLWICHSQNQPRNQKVEKLEKQSEEKNKC
jgi:hypothetical protein